ncbi:MAG: hypothetical protein DLM52_10260 [Chthoniobacterales bacterium]|nr:MAG: hypothetical protein DLM52_10260 [Chthoniobacterales bacterium]
MIILPNEIVRPAVGNYDEIAVFLCHSERHAAKRNEVEESLIIAVEEEQLEILRLRFAPLGMTKKVHGS